MNFKFNWGHGIALALGTFICFILYLIFIFPIGQSNSELITDQYYEEELVYQNVIDAKNNADKLPEKPVYSQSSQGIKVTFPKDYNNANTKAKFYLYRDNDANLDVKKDIVLEQDNSFSIPSKILVLGHYTLKVMWTKDKKEYQTDYNVEWK